jgi:hypothetical protein
MRRGCRAQPAPRLGEHTDEILLEVLGLSEGEVGRNCTMKGSWPGQRDGNYYFIY